MNKTIIAILSVLTVTLACVSGHYIVQANQANRGDLNHDGKVSLPDMSIFLSQYQAKH